MHRRPLGPTGLFVTPLGLGMAALGRPGYINIGHAHDLEHDYRIEAMTERAYEVLDTARALGITYFDAARSYGRAEEFLGGWLRSRAIDPADITVGSKWGYTYTADWRVDAEHHEVKDHGVATLRRQLPESLAHLGEQLDLYQVHSATLESGVLDDEVVLDELAARREQGLAVGLTTSGPRQSDVILRASSIERGGRRVFDVVQTTWNVLEPSAGPALRQAHDAGLGVIVKEALANGRLTDRNPTLDPRVRQSLLDAVGPAGSIGSVALAHALQQEWADVVLSGAATVEQLESNVSALNLASSLDSDEFATLAEPADRYWRTRQSLPWN